ncbi:MAG: OB-fold nucleic acid binding domain-containing protein [Prevotella sp.]|nr:OB-fold nucleic acid binding domain-containing protein [Prevotella sp.]
MKKIIYSVFMMVMVTMAFTSCADVPMPYDDPNQAAIDEEGSTIEPEGLGTADDPYNVAAANALIESGEAPSTNVYVKGKIVSIKEIDTGSFGNATFYISDDGTSKDQLTVYRSKSLGNKNFKSEEEIKDGDEVVICGVLVNYNGTYEFTQGCYIYSLNGETSGGSTPSGPVAGSGTLEDPYNVAAISQLAASLASNAKSDNVYFKGKVSSIKENFGTKYGNATFNISDDGTTNGEFLIFQCLYLGNVKYTEGDLLKEGDEVIIYGKVTNYQGNTPESSKGEAYVYSLNGKTGDTGGDTGEVKKITIKEFNEAAESNSVWYQLTGKVTNMLENDKYGNFDLVDETGSVYVYGLLSEKGGPKQEFQKLVEEKGIKEGSVITIIGNRGSYNGRIEVLNAYFVSIDNSGDSTPTTTLSKETSGTTITFTNGSVTASSNKITVNFNDQGWADKDKVYNLTLSDGTTLTFSNGDGTTQPSFYAGTKGIRFYAKNTLVVKSSKTVAKVVLTCDSYAGTDYVGNDRLKAYNRETTLTIMNDHTDVSGGLQLRVQTMEITYAQ